MENNVQNLTDEDWSSKDDRIVLSKANAYTRKTYFNRYAFAAKKIKEATPLVGDTIIDCACGDGAGSAFLAEQTGYYVYGVDIDPVVIAKAIITYKDELLNYKVGNILDFDASGIAVFVCLETMEHINNEDMHKALKYINDNVLAPGGTFIVSMPRLRPRESTKKRPGHINELYYQEFKYTLGQYFPMIDYYSVDRYANIVPDSPDANCMIAVCTKWPDTEIF
jgi:2-polyprenyl-3-methyl-5-hydroxy-6-metoxy-1,4-benzoquinol methylase